MPGTLFRVHPFHDRSNLCLFLSLSQVPGCRYALLWPPKEATRGNSRGLCPYKPLTFYAICFSRVYYSRGAIIPSYAEATSIAMPLGREP